MKINIRKSTIINKIILNDVLEDVMISFCPLDETIQNLNSKLLIITFF